MSKNIYTEEFPSLPQKKRTFPTKTWRNRRLFETDEPVTKLQNGSYYLSEDATLRPCLNCNCQLCYTAKGAPRKGTWDDPCDNTSCVPVGSTVQITNSKILKIEGEKYSVSFMQTNMNKRRICGWVLSKTLNRLITTRSQSLLQTRAARFFEEEENRSRSPTPCVAAALEKPEPTYKYGDVVEVKTGFGANARWIRGEVKQEEPLKVLLAGKTQSQKCHPSLVREHTTREFITNKDLVIRQAPLDNWCIQNLEKGSIVKVAYMEGYEGRIISPVQGWITIRSDHELNVSETNFTYSPQKPTIIVNDVPKEMTKTWLKVSLQIRHRLKPTNVEFQTNGKEIRALVTLNNNHEKVSNLIDGKTISIGTHAEDFQQATIFWDLRYLKNQAALRVQENNNKKSS